MLRMVRCCPTYHSSKGLLRLRILSGSQSRILRLRNILDSLEKSYVYVLFGELMRRHKIILDPRFDTAPNTRILTMQEMGKLIRLRRKELGMTQADVSRMTDLSMRLVGEVERGKEHVAADKILRLLDALNMTMIVHVEGK